MKNFIALALVSALAVFAAACSNSTETSNTNTTPATTTTTVNSASANTSATVNTGATPASTALPKSASGEDAPASVRAALPDAQSITKHHKDLSSAQIQKETGSKVPDTDHHSYLAFSNSSGARQQIGAATVVKAAGQEMVIVYENRGGKPYIKEVRAEGMPGAFLDQFKGKGHDEKFQIGQDLKAQGVNDATAKAAAEAVRVDIMTMQTLYGAADKH